MNKLLPVQIVWGMRNADGWISPCMEWYPPTMQFLMSRSLTEIDARVIDQADQSWLVSSPRRVFEPLVISPAPKGMYRNRYDYLASELSRLLSDIIGPEPQITAYLDTVE